MDPLLWLKHSLMSSTIDKGIPKKLTEQERSLVLAPLKSRGWTKMQTKRDAIRKTFEFKDFVSAFGFMTRVAIASEKINHHPEVRKIFDRKTA